MDDLRTEERVLKTNRDAMELRKKDLNHQIVNAQTIKQSSHEELEKLKEEKAKLALMKRHVDDMTASNKEASERIYDRENKLKIKEKALASINKDLMKRESYLKIKERGESQ